MVLFGWEFNVLLAQHQSCGAREPAVAGSFYPRASGELKATVEHLLAGAPAAGTSGALLGVIAPHAGYVYSGAIAAKAFAAVAASGKNFSRVLLIGPPHYIAVHGVTAPSSRAFTTPLGDVPVDTQAIGSLRDAGLITIDDAPHAPEHSLEVELPFLQSVLGNFAIVPLLVGDAAPSRVAKIVAAVQDESTLFVVSTDLSHYLDDAAARRRDLVTAETIERLDFARLGPQDACGYAALNGALCAAKQNGWNIGRIDLGTSGDTSGDYLRVVGYGAWAFSAPPRL
jgi:AmmeMemoRadiSam system protein B